MKKFNIFKIEMFPLVGRRLLLGLGSPSQRSYREKTTFCLEKTVELSF
jgi:hypothetical protein